MLLRCNIEEWAGFPQRVRESLLSTRRMSRVTARPGNKSRIYYSYPDGHRRGNLHPLIIDATPSEINTASELPLFNDFCEFEVYENDRLDGTTYIMNIKAADILRITAYDNDHCFLYVHHNEVDVSRYLVRYGLESIYNILIGGSTTTGEDFDWSSYWATLISATVETAAPTHVVLTFPTAQASLGASDFTIAGFTISSASWTGAVLTLVLSVAVTAYNDDFLITFVKTGTTATVTNNVAIANTVGWYVAGDGSATYVTKDGSDLVSVWKDLSGSNHPLNQATGTNQPKWESGGILFDGEDNYLQTANFVYAQPEMVYMVVKQITFSSNDGIFAGGGSLGMCYQSGTSPNIALNASVAINNNTFGLNRFRLLKACINGANGLLQINEFTASTGAVGASAMGSIRVGANSWGNAFANIQIKEAIFRSTADDETTRGAISNYLYNKYDLRDADIIGIIGDSTIAAYATGPYVSVRSLLSGTRIYNDCSLTGGTIATQYTAFNNFVDKAETKVLFVAVGINDLASGTLIADYQTMINNLRSITSATCKIILCTLVPSDNWDGAPYTALNTAIRGGGATPITGADGYIDVANSDLNDGTDKLKAIYAEDGVDGGHENDLGRAVIAALWDAKLAELGF